MARTLWSLSVLALLRERPMHPYELQRQMHLRHTDERLGLKRGSLYHAINQLQRDGLIEPIETSRAGRRPERTVYQITRDGEEELLNWTRELLSEPVREPSQFTAALAHIVHLRPRDALEQLRKASCERIRAQQLAGDVRADVDARQIANGLVTIVLSLLMSLIQTGNDPATLLGRDVAAVVEAALSPPSGVAPRRPRRRPR